MTQDQEFVQALGKTPSGLFIVTAAHGSQRAGFLGSFVQQASFEPLIFSVAVHPDRYPYQIMQQSGTFALNLIPEGDKILLKTFGKGHGPEADPFTNVEHDTLDGLPILKDAIGAATFKIVHTTQPGDHVIVFGEAVNGKLFQAEIKPWVHIRKSAKSY